MKKWKELLWIFIPFVLLAIADVWVYVWRCLHQPPEFSMGYTVSDPEFWSQVYDDALFEPLICAVLFVLPLGLAVRWLPVPRRWKYVLMFVGAVLCMGTLLFAGLRERVFAWYILLHFAHIGSTVVFFVWLAECVWTAVKNLIRRAKQ